MENKLMENKLLQRLPITNIGQLTKEEIKFLEKCKLVGKYKGGMFPVLKTVYYLKF